MRPETVKRVVCVVYIAVLCVLGIVSLVAGQDVAGLSALVTAAVITVGD